MTDDPKRTGDRPGGPEERDPELDREDVKDLTPSDEDAEDVRGGRACCGGNTFTHGDQP